MQKPVLYGAAAAIVGSALVLVVANTNKNKEIKKRRRIWSRKTRAKQRARRMIESTFEILANRFRALLTPINLAPEKVEIITLCCVVLHNFLVVENQMAYCDSSANGLNTAESLQLIARHGGNRNSTDARKIRDEFKDFFNSSGVRDWQYEQVNRNNM
ncbi:hypothetical protein ILUMI_21162 [Ignelater luminosus]|uniref:DDE Tnp4 domain-containing protein n=1 Tax=Ignelater luminosus TaxID=2038154 RepID=A0A8K0G3W8_IGNLU|nr:hypothetical protein ILUMI_21162 [Ignelater luminosus]